MLRIMARDYPNTKNEELADLFGICVRTVYRKAKELGLKKSKGFMADARQRGQIISRLNPNNAGRIKKGEHRGFKPGHVPHNIRAMIRMDTLEVYPSARALARALGVAQSNVTMAAKYGGRCHGIHINYYYQDNERD